MGIVTIVLAITAGTAALMLAFLPHTPIMLQALALLTCAGLITAAFAWYTGWRQEEHGERGRRMTHRHAH